MDIHIVMQSYSGEGGQVTFDVSSFKSIYIHISVYIDYMYWFIIESYPAYILNETKEKQGKIVQSLVYWWWYWC